MLTRILLLSVAVLFTGCTTFRSTLLDRTDSGHLHPSGEVPIKGVPIAVHVPTHLDVYIDETYFVAENSQGVYEELPLLDPAGQPLRSLGIRPEMIYTKKIFVVDFKRAAAGTTSVTLGFNDQQYLNSIAGEIEDNTLNEATAAITAIAPLLGGRTSRAAESKGFTSEVISGSRVVAYRRFDLDTPDFEQQVADFVTIHINACHDCTGNKFPFPIVEPTAATDLSSTTTTKEPPTADAVVQVAWPTDLPPSGSLPELEYDSKSTEAVR